MDESIEDNSNLIISIMFICILLGIMLLGVVVIINSLNTANENYGGSVIISQINESGYLSEDGYTFEEGDSDFIVINVIRQSDGEVIDPSNYTIIGNKIYLVGDLE